MLNVKEKVMRFLEEFYVCEQTTAAVCIAETAECLGYFDSNAEDFEPELLESAKWLLDYQTEKIAAAQKELTDALVPVLTGGENIQMSELGVVLNNYNQKETSKSTEEAEDVLFSVFEDYGTGEAETIKFDDENAFEKFVKWFSEQVSY